MRNVVVRHDPDEEWNSYIRNFYLTGKRSHQLLILSREKTFDAPGTTKFILRIKELDMSTNRPHGVRRAHIFVTRLKIWLWSSRQFA